GQVKISGAGKESFITITQKQVEELIVDQKEFSIGSDGGTITIPVISNVDYSCSLSDNCKSWCSITQTKALNNYNIILSVAKNEGYDPRTGTLTISYGDNSTRVTITQSQKDELILTQKEFTIGTNGGVLRIPVLTNINYTATVLGDAQSWIGIYQVQTKGLEEYKLVLQIAKNSAMTGRVGQVKISGAGKESFITITQGANEEPSALGKERTALTALYNSLNGNQWTRKDNWLTDKPLDE
ncbi:MAG TPA: BACON domain-containing carbohydrate-binding protein, partial [Bacteroidales bacterium]|nr:BACON domain-containing carbohydrate-binding protein [Bacteroidales bacterium]